jgi:hypothetical protein
MPKLRDGSKVRDARLTRIAQFDEKSRKFPIRKLLKGKEPRSRLWGCDLVLDQGEEGACVGAACTHELIAKPKPVRGLNMRFAREQVYWEAQKLDEWDGGSYPGAKPQYEGTSVLCGVKVLQKLGYIEEYRWSFSLDDLALAVGHVGPAILGLVWYDGMFEPHSCGYLHATGKASGGHAILCRGVNVKERYFVLHNSWGSKWGNGGTAKVSFADMAKLLKEEGEAVVPLVRRLLPR